MGMFSDLMGKIFRGGAKAEAPPDAARPGVTPESRVQAANREAGINPTATTPGSMAPVGGGNFDIESSLNAMAAGNDEKLDWRKSIVDLLKLVGMESSLSARKELAEELKYTGDMNDSAKMNMWLHKEVMRKLAENGGKVPADLLDN